jgi:hypothetical protein
VGPEAKGRGYSAFIFRARLASSTHEAEVHVDFSFETHEHGHERAPPYARPCENNADERTYTTCTVKFRQRQEAAKAAIAFWHYGLDHIRQVAGDSSGREFVD